MNATIERTTDRGFGFITTAEGTDDFFHQAAGVGNRFEELREGQRVSFTLRPGPKGPRAENVIPQERLVVDRDGGRPGLCQDPGDDTRTHLPARVAPLPAISAASRRHRFGLVHGEAPSAV